MNRISAPSRIILAIAALSLIATFFLPIWAIYLVAPQYPEGLSMQIWLYKLSGQVEIINGLNHYIGMKHIKEEMFPEFGYLVYIAGFYILLGLVVAFMGKRKILGIYCLLLLLAGALAMYDFYQWGYDYGHNLDPAAAIQVPGLFYQPPLIGHKQLLNFDAYSYPDTGGWIVVVAGLIFIAVWIYEGFKKRSTGAVTRSTSTTVATAAATLAFIFTSCSVEPQPFAIGKDLCDDCKMTIMDNKFGGEIITKKGRIYKFDDLHCMLSFINSEKVASPEISKSLVIDYHNPGNFVDATAASYTSSEQIKSPMGSNTAAFANNSAASDLAKKTSGKVITWNQLINE